MALEWVPRGDDNEWNNQCEYLYDDGMAIGVVWYSTRDYVGQGVEGVQTYKKNQWYYASIDGGTAALEATGQAEAKALCIMECKLT